MVEKIRQVEYLERWKFQLLVENRDSHSADLGRQSERLLKSERAAKGARTAKSLLLRIKGR